MELFSTSCRVRVGTFVFLSFLMSSVQAASVSDLLITEVMVNPNAVSDTNGEWFELFNPTSEAIDLNGLTLKDLGSNTHTITTTSTLFINPDQYFIFARNGDSSTNGGFVADYVYGSGFQLTNSGDEIIFTDSSNELLRLEYGTNFDAIGRSSELTSLPVIELNYDLTLASLTYGLGDIGTPGSAGSFIPNVSAVPLPATIWFFISGVILLFRQQLKSGKKVLSQQQI